jgi:hypothetical protein
VMGVWREQFFFFSVSVCVSSSKYYFIETTKNHQATTHGTA